eukprot:CAMPEP_0197634302 /NCGR_PEP_ID=MMETSP1338-20131121/10435_1 /TAXON_ID=43686 ORGANISM="Pelagodinium beii, Strain RCC1491" /NCGR_SAMPLE_ID=MMETSP1338 /ASSEMBLY_ACC=CAM_ASM_000754 /LENGTH=49 /DNA_ID=CAMNT_0043206141 /DNA_START=39 /DNA_END=188 /DNA_ORIENTATION=-
MKKSFPVPGITITNLADASAATTCSNISRMHLANHLARLRVFSRLPLLR